jgi:hypothetical protein
MGGPGHLEPLLPIALAARDAGHSVAVAGRPSALHTASALELDVFATASDRKRPAERTPLLPVDMEREARDLRVGFAERNAREHAASVGQLSEAWRPDVLVCDESDFGSLSACSTTHVSRSDRLTGEHVFV